MFEMKYTKTEKYNISIVNKKIYIDGFDVSKIKEKDKYQVKMK